MKHRELDVYFGEWLIDAFKRENENEKDKYPLNAIPTNCITFLFFKKNPHLCNQTHHSLRLNYKQTFFNSAHKKKVVAKLILFFNPLKL
ncbi:MAG: hypothetical protein LBN27_07640 [Prevotellaceae bacterium]|jgi:hypothetical protein|nr:hypothetical protein [Prevotellaceae bacterium]